MNDYQQEMSCPIMKTNVGYGYVPIQEFKNLYSPQEALKNGTLFAELNLPLGVYER